MKLQNIKVCLEISFSKRLHHWWSEFEFAKFRFMRAFVPAWFTCQRAYVPKAYVCAKSVSACHFYEPTCQCTSQPTKRRTNMPKNVSIFQTFLLWNAKGNFYNLFLNKKSCIILDIILIHMCICIAHKNCIILHFRTSCHLKETCVEFLLSETFLLFSFLFLYVTNN